jgi:hypothetical protein
MNRADRLRRAVPGAPAELVTALAARPAAEVDLIVALARQARRDAISDDRARRRQKVADRRRYGHVEDQDQAAATGRMLAAVGHRAGRSIDALAGLVRFERETIPDLKRMAVADLRAQGYSDPAIGRALGITSQRVGQLYGLKSGFQPAGPESGRAS